MTKIITIIIVMITWIVPAVAIATQITIATTATCRMDIWITFVNLGNMTRKVENFANDMQIYMMYS